MRLSLLLTLCAAPALAHECGLYEAIEPGDSISAIAARCGTTPEAIFAANPDIIASELKIGGVLQLQADASAPETEARALYESYFLGAYSPEPVCAGQEFQVFLDADTVQSGEQVCDITRMEIYEDMLEVELENCRSEGEPTDPYRLRLARQPGRAIEYFRNDDGWRLERCTDY